MTNQIIELLKVVLEANETYVDLIYLWVSKLVCWSGRTADRFAQMNRLLLVCQEVAAS